jgi:hypothetical protein
MVSIAAADLLNVWERGRAEPPYARALHLLAAALPDATFESIADWGLGRRDATLLALREQLFGDRFNAVATCPECEARLEMDFSTADIRADYATDELPPVKHVHDGHVYMVRLRPLTTRDILEVAADPVQDNLMRRVTLEARRDGESAPVGELPPDVMADCTRTIFECDPQADVQLALTCPECGHRWDALFDITTYLWSEVETWAARTLREVHLLASVYGWTESEILSLSSTRRRAYLQMAAG